MAASGVARGPARGRAIHIALWVLQVLLGVFFVVASAAPKLLGQQYAVTMFDQIGAGQWMRYFVGACELAGGVGLMVPALAGLAALGIVALMAGAFLTHLLVAVLGPPATPVILAVLAAVVVWGRWSEIVSLPGRLRG